MATRASDSAAGVLAAEDTIGMDRREQEADVSWKRSTSTVTLQRQNPWQTTSPSCLDEVEAV